jgi:hypothetical protein
VVRSVFNGLMDQVSLDIQYVRTVLKAVVRASDVEGEGKSVCPELSRAFQAGFSIPPVNFTTTGCLVTNY